MLLHHPMKEHGQRLGGRRVLRMPLGATNAMSATPPHMGATATTRLVLRMPHTLLPHVVTTAHRPADTTHPPAVVVSTPIVRIAQVVSIPLKALRLVERRTSSESFESDTHWRSPLGT